jgi:phage-related tail fiber protein
VPTNYPTTIDSYTNKLDGVSDVLAADINNLQDAVLALQNKVGVASSTAGEVIFTTKSVPPTGYLKANGAAVSRTTYAALFGAIGTTYGAGNGSTTFNLPDLRGEFLRGWDDGRGVDSGRTLGSAQLDQMQRITGTYQALRITVRVDETAPVVSGALGWNASFAGGSALASGNTANITFDSANSPSARASSTTAGETRARNVALLACIRYA